MLVDQRPLEGGLAAYQARVLAIVASQVGAVLPG
jgi:hypothetical protein